MSNAFAIAQQEFRHHATQLGWTFGADGTVGISPGLWLTARIKHSVVCAAAMPVLSRISICTDWARSPEAGSYSYTSSADKAAKVEHVHAVCADFKATEALLEHMRPHCCLVEYPGSISAAIKRALTRLQAGEQLVTHRANKWKKTTHTIGGLKISEATVTALRNAGILSHAGLVTNATARAEWQTRNGMS